MLHVFCYRASLKLPYTRQKQGIPLDSCDTPRPLIRYPLAVQPPRTAEHTRSWLLKQAIHATALLDGTALKMVKDDRNMENNRWSEVIPPHNALTFAAVWDPAEGMVTFSGAHLLESESGDPADARPTAGDAPRDILDSQSQVLTIDRLALALGGTAPSTAAFACEDFALDHGAYHGWLEPPLHAPHSPAIASSTVLAHFAGQGGQGDPRRLLRACLNRFHPGELERRKRFAVRLPSSRSPPSSSSQGSSTTQTVSDEGFFEGRRRGPHDTYENTPVFVNVGGLKSAFSVSSTSTTNYIEVDFPTGVSYIDSQHMAPQAPGVDADSCSSSWLTVREIDHAFCYPHPMQRGRRLQKRPRTKSTLSKPANPTEVLAREYYNHDSPCPSLPTVETEGGSIIRAKKMLDRLSKCRKSEDDERWVCIDVTHKVTQRII